MRESFSQKFESEDSILEEKFAKFVAAGEYTAEKIREAYYLLLGVGEEGKENSRINSVKDEMEVMVRAHYPLNRFARFIEMKDELKGSVQRYENFVNNIKISDNEKRLLKSIVEKSRLGSLEFHVNDEPFARIEISEIKSREITADAMLEKLSEVLLKLALFDQTEVEKISFWFEEK